MNTPLLRALRFGLHWGYPRRNLAVRSRPIPREDGGPPTQGILYEPIAGGPRRRGWVLLHGMTRVGLAHPGLDRFARALASTGGRVLVPEIREWMELEFAPEQAQDVLCRAVRSLATDPESEPGGVVLIGISFGGPQALHAAASGALAPHLRGVVSWGGYGDLERTFRFHLTGEHEAGGETYHQRPDPYGRWIVGSNLIPLAPELRDRREVAGGLRWLAQAAGERRIDSWDPVFDPVKVKLRNGMPPGARELFDLFAPPADREPEREGAEALIPILTKTARERLPLLDPFSSMSRLETPARLLHGRSDHLIPFTETIRLAERLTPLAPHLKSHITGFFAHSGTARHRTAREGIREASHFVGALRDVFELG